MNGIHDMGGMMGFGPVVPEPDEPVFHEPWEARVFGLAQGGGTAMPWTLDEDRHSTENRPAATYLATPYYGGWLDTMERLMVKYGSLTAEELRSGRSAGKLDPAPKALSPETAVAQCLTRYPYEREIAAPAAFAPGDAVRAVNINPAGHTRLPRYLRGRSGEILRCHGAHVFPDTNAHGRGEDPRHLYTVRFSARELWGDGHGADDFVMADLWEPYLRHA